MVALLFACNSPEVPPGGDAPAVAPSAVLSADAVVFVDEPTGFDAGESEGALYTWDFGDGTSVDGAAVTHTYEAPGRYTVRLIATGEDGRSDTASGTRVAVVRPLAQAPTSSGRLALDGTRVYAALPDDDTVAVVTGTDVERWAVCGAPVSVSAAAGLLAVACRDDAVQLWRDGSLLMEAIFRWGSRPMGVAVDAAGAWVALAGTGELAFVALDGTVSTLGPLPDPRAVAAGGGAVFSARFRSPVGGGVAARFADAVTEFPLLPDPGPDSDTDARGLPTLLGAVALRPDGGALIVAGSKANTERGLQRDGLPYTHETATRAALRSLDPVTGAQLERALFDNRDRVGAVAFTPLGDRLLVAHHGAGVVDVLDPFTLARIGGFQAVGVGLDGIATDGQTAWVLASVDQELVAYDLTAGNTQVEVLRVGLGVPSLGAQVFHDAADPRMGTDAYLACSSCHPDGEGDGQTWDFTDRGEGFRDTQALFALPVAGPFHWTANFDEIQDFENAIRDHQAGDGFLSDADFAATADPLGAPKIGLSPELDALAGYVVSFPVPRSPFRDPDGAPTAAGLRGRTVFEGAGCGSCHAGPEGTDAGWNPDGTPILNDIGTILPTSGFRIGEPLTGLRTPSLRGLFATGPWLHDGRAATLEAAVTAHGGSLSAGDLSDLVQYLREIEAAP